MNLRLRAAAVSVLALAAACLGAYAIRSITADGGKDPPDYYIEADAGPEDAAYILRDCDGYIGVYTPGKLRTPQDVTDIEVSRLRESDRKLLEEGIPVSSRDELLTLLEDFGS
jgi:hypothetical protein